MNTDKMPNFMKHISDLAKDGDYKCVFLLGMIYINGTKVYPYPEESKFWLKKAYNVHPEWFCEDLKKFVLGF